MITLPRSFAFKPQYDKDTEQMSYIAALHCKGGIVLCADTQATATYGQKQYFEKLLIPDDNTSYPIAIGAAGTSEIVDATQKEIIERVTSSRPPDLKTLRALIREAVDYVYTNDLPVSAYAKQWRTSEFLIAAKVGQQFEIVKLKGKRTYTVKKHEIVGYATPVNRALIQRLYRDSLPMQQAVMLAMYLVSMSKAVDAYVGGGTQIAVVVDNGAWIEDSIYVSDAEKRIEHFLKLTDDMFLNAIDMSMQPGAFEQRLLQFQENVRTLRQEYMNWTGHRSFERTFNEPDYKGDPYPKVFPGAVATITTSGISVREETPQEREQLNRMLEEGKNPTAQSSRNKLVEMVGSRTLLYVGTEIISNRGKPPSS